MVGGYSWERKKIRKAAKPKARKAKARVALVTMDLMRFLFTGKRLGQGETKRKSFLEFFSGWGKGPDLRGKTRVDGATWGRERSGAAKGEWDAA